MKMTTLCYLENNGDYLMLLRNRKKQDENAGKWIGVGGKFEDGESPEECMLREIWEETGLVPAELHFRGILVFRQDQNSAEYMHLFTGTVSRRDFSPCDEGDLKWISKDGILSLNLWEGDRKFLELLLNESPFFFMTLKYHGEHLAETSVSYPL